MKKTQLHPPLAAAGRERPLQCLSRESRKLLQRRHRRRSVAAFPSGRRFFSPPIYIYTYFSMYVYLCQSLAPVGEDHLTKRGRTEKMRDFERRPKAKNSLPVVGITPDQRREGSACSERGEKICDTSGAGRCVVLEKEL